MAQHGDNNDRGTQQTIGARRRGAALGRRLALLLLLGAALGFALSALGNLLMTSLGLYFNTSDSLPYGLYQATYRSDLKVGFFGLEAQGTVQPLVLTRGDLVLVCLPPSVAAVARERNYVNSGKCAANTAPVGKHIVAQAGDLVAVDAMGVVVNGQLLPQSAPVAQDASGALMPRPQVPLPYQLRAGEYWVLNAKANSFDSRYFGVVTATEVIATLQPLLTF